MTWVVWITAVIAYGFAVMQRTSLGLGTGTGAILISLLAARPGMTGLGTDISEAALQVARHNARRIGVDARSGKA